jgi:hypothetical protein
MGTPREPSPVRLFAGIMYDEGSAIDRVLKKLEKKFGKTALSFMDRLLRGRDGCTP